MNTIDQKDQPPRQKENKNTAENDQIDQGLDLIQQGFTIFDANMKLVKFNRAFISMYDLPASLARHGTTFEAINLYLAKRGEFGPGNSEEQVKARVELAKKFEPHYIERTRPDGKRFAIEGHPLQQGGWVTTYSNITSSTTEQRVLQTRSDVLADRLLIHAEEQARSNRELAAANRALEQAKTNLQASEARIRTITNALPAHIAYVDRNYIYRFSNNRLEDVMNIRTEGVLGKHMSDVFPKETYNALRTKIDQAFNGGVVTAEHTVRDGEIDAQAIRTILSPEYNPDGDVLGAFVLSINVSAEKAATQMQVRAKRMETMAQLTSGLAHDFSNILTIILGNLHRLSKGANSVQNELLRSTQKAAKRGTRITENLMSLLYRHQMNDSQANVSNILKELVPLFSSLNTDIEFEIQLPEDDIFATVDEGAIQDVVLNILFNAKDAIESSENHGKIILASKIIQHREESLDNLEIKVIDSGNGFSSQALKLGAEAFFSTKPQGKGTGLGLSMVSSIAEQLGGKLELSNTCEPSGAMVTFTIPRTPQTSDVDELSDTLSNEHDQPIVLIVDDSAEIRELLRVQVSQMGLLAVEASHVKEALTLLEQLTNINLVISDIDMPGEHNGLQFAQLLGKTHPDLDILLVSGLPKGSDTLNRAQSEFTVLSKPLNLAQVDAYVATALNIVQTRDGHT